ncbi:DUF3263 domain-containing protein, partial [Corynebacterium bovis]|uniref:DUF3263 domain-containing protein n=1 Tax=Corynebacterium bovis TaxID=36808 RepID=UPI0031397E70
MDAVGRGGDDGRLSERDLEMLAFERRWWRRRGARDEEIRRRFGVTPVRYFQQLNGLSERDLEMLAFERRWWRRRGARDEEIRRRFGVTPVR